MAQFVSASLWQAAPLLAFESPEVRRANRLGAKKPENTRCMNCQEPKPEYVCMDFRTFVCGQCSEAHLEFGHKTTAIADPEWEEADVERVAERGGNRRATSRWLAFWDAGEYARPQRDDHQRRREFIRKAYVVKCWHRQPKATRQRARPEAASSGVASPRAGCPAAGDTPPPRPRTQAGASRANRMRRMPRAPAAAEAGGTRRPSSSSDGAWAADTGAHGGADAAEPPPAEAEARAARPVSPYRRTCKRTGAVEYPPWLTDAVARSASPRREPPSSAAEDLPDLTRHISTDSLKSVDSAGSSDDCAAADAVDEDKEGKVADAKPSEGTDASQPASAAPNEDESPPPAAAAASDGPAERRLTPRTLPYCRGSGGEGAGLAECASSRGAAGRFSALDDVSGSLREYERPAAFGELLQVFDEKTRAWEPGREPAGVADAAKVTAAPQPAGACLDGSPETAGFGWL